MIYEELIHQQDYWPLQIIQDEYGYALDIPLRIYNKSAVENIDFSSLFPKLKNSHKFKNFHDYVTAVACKPLENIEMLEDDKAIWKKFFTKEREKSCWLTNQSSGYFLIHAFQDSSLWRWWEFFYYYYQFVIKSNSNKATYFNCDKKHLHIVFQPISIKEAPNEKPIICVLVAGPVWEPIDFFTGTDFEKKRVTQLVQSVLPIVGKIAMRKYPLIRLGNNRFPMNYKYLIERLRRVCDCLTQVLKTKLPNDCNMHRCDHAKLAEWSLFALQIHKNLSCDKIPCNDISTILLDKTNKSKIYRRLNHPEMLQGEMSPWLETTWTELNNTDDSGEKKIVPEYKIQYKEPPRRNRIDSLHIEVPKDFDEKCKETFESSLTTFLNKVFVRKSARRTRALLVLRKWLNDRFRIVNCGQPDISEIHNWLCRWIADRVTANQVTIYYYNHDSRYVEKLGFYSLNDEQKKWEKLITDYVQFVGENEQRELSICYRCIDERKTLFVRAFDPEKEAVPKNKSLLLPPEGVEEANRSAIATPIFVYGRIWGVLEVNSFYPYHFCWNNRTFIEEVASIFSPFFYQQHFLEGIHNLTKISIENKSYKQVYKEQMYNDVAHQSAIIFLSHSATLWIAGEQSDGNYKCVGWYNRPDLEELLETRKGEWWDSQKDSNIIDEAIEHVKDKQETPYQNSVGKEPFNQIWVESQPPKFQKLNIKHVCVIPVVARDGKTIGSIFLYNQTNEGPNEFDERWLPKTTLVSQHVALLLEAIQTRQEKKELKNVIAHEIKQNATLMADRTTSFKNYVNYNFHPNDSQKRRIYLFNHDLNKFTNDLLEDIKWFSSEDNTSKKEHHSHKNIVIAKAYDFSKQEPELLNFRE